jgi:arginine--tRNA ligase
LVDFWQKTRAMCLEDMQKIFSELGTEHFDKRYFESTVEQPGIKKVYELLEQGIAQKSQGAIVMNLEEYDLGVFLLLKSNGASLYSTKDIALAYQKKADFPEYDQSLYVVGLEQEHHFQQLFKTLDLIGFDQSKLHHVSYGLVDLVDGKMSSRAGNVVLYEDFRDQLLAKATEMMDTRDLPADQKHNIAHQVAFGAMKFGMLLQDSEKGITFDRNQALSFEGESGPYLQYMGARISSILKKAPAPDFSALDYNLLNTEGEKNLILLLAHFPDLVQKAAQDYKPNTIARFALTLAKQFSSYYHSVKILDDQNPSLSNARLCLLVLVHQTLQNALNLLGIELPESM